MISGVEECAVEDGRLALIEAARQSNIVINATKSQLPGLQITVFNIVLSNGEMALTADRMYKFEKDLTHATQPAAEAILAYARSVNSAQVNKLAAGDGTREVSGGVGGDNSVDERSPAHVDRAPRRALRRGPRHQHRWIGPRAA